MSIFSSVCHHGLKMILTINLLLFTRTRPRSLTKTSPNSSEDSRNLTFFVISSSWQRVYWYNYLKVMPVFVCVPLSLFFSVIPLSLVNVPTRISLSTSPLFSLALCPSVSQCALRSPPPPLRRHRTFITAWPWLSLLFSLLWCSITLSSWGKHRCQATVMTFWLSVFMWWMRWKCTTTAKQGLALCQTATPQSWRMRAAKQQNK